MVQAISSHTNLTDQLECKFPTKLCCNCGRTDSLQTVVQDTRVTRYFFLGGSEITFNLQLPFCPECIATARRRPISLVKKLLVFIITFGASVLALTIVAELFLSNKLLPDHIIYLSLGASTAFIFIISFLRMPTGHQTSFYQPVRITSLKQEFFSGDVKKANIYFTNSLYASEFTALNQESIINNVVGVKTA